MAGSFSKDFIESVRDAGDIVRLVSDYVPLKQAGSRLKGLCPFHDEKTPSFSVDPERQLFYCFGCQAGGDIFHFVELYEKMAFPEAVEFLARRWGVRLPRRDRREEEGPAARVLRLNDAAQAWFRSMLADPGAGKACRAYLERRGLREETASKLGLGFAPDGWEVLRGHLLSGRFKPEELLTGGLVLPRKSGSGQYDRFRNRLIFPIRDVNGRTVAFGGRTLGDDEPKYINSPETPAYKKGEHLYGLDLSREAIRRQGFAIVVEGYLDLAAVLQAGCDNVVASLGTAFTGSQAKLLSRYCKRVVFSYDGDAAGTSATERSLDLLLGRGFKVHVVELPGGEDPDDTIRRHGAEAYAELVKQAPEYLEFLIRSEARKAAPRRAEGKVEAVNAVLPHLAKLSSAVERGTWAARLADALRIDDELVLQELRSAVKGSRRRVRQRAAEERPLRDAEARLVSMLLRCEDARSRFVEGDPDPTEIEDAEVWPIVRTIVELARTGDRLDAPAVLDALESEADRALLTRILFREEPEEGPTVEDCLSVLRKKKLVAEGRQLRFEIEETPPSDVDHHLARLQKLARQRDALC